MENEKGKVSNPLQNEFENREKRFKDAVGLKGPDRVPVVPLVHYYPNRIAGISNKEAIRDYSKGFGAFRDFTVKFKLDMAPTPYPLVPLEPCVLLGLIQYLLPGHGLGDNAATQYVEKEYMLAEEYDEFLSSPDAFTVRKIWPRIAEALEPLANFTAPHMILEGRSLVFAGGSLISTDSFRTFLEMLIKLSKEMALYNDAVSQYTTEMADLGFPLHCVAGARAPFDIISDFLRGLKGSVLDMYRVPDKLLQTIDYLTPDCYKVAMKSAIRAGNDRILLTLHRGAAGLMSDEQFKKFYWPSLKKVILSLVDAGLTPMPFFEGDYSPRLEYLAELPKGKILGHFDIIDRKKAKRIIGNTMCFWGNVPASMLITGTKDQVRDNVKELIDTFADNGGLIIDASVGIPDEAKPENVEAMIDTVFEYGKN